MPAPVAIATRIDIVSLVGGKLTSEAKQNFVWRFLRLAGNINVEINYVFEAHSTSLMFSSN